MESKRQPGHHTLEPVSILVCELLPDGIVFAADKNVTTVTFNASGERVSTVQDLGSKILRWPKHRALLGYVGAASVGGQTMYDWLYDFIGDHFDFTEPAVVANDMCTRLQKELGGTKAQQSIVEFAAFATRDGCVVPEFWHITNVHGLTETGYQPASETFIASEQLLRGHLKDQLTPANIRDFLYKRAMAFDPFWFHQGFDLSVFNTVTEAARQAFVALQQCGKLPHPQTLADWERHARMRVLTYGAYFEAFGEPGQRFVGGGADVLSIPWPT